MNRKPGLLELAEKLVDYGRKNGADEIQVNIGESIDFSVTVLEGQIETLSESGAKAVSIKVIKDQKSASVSSSDLRLGTLHGLIDRAVRRVVFLNADPYSALPDEEPVDVNAESLKIYDASLESMTPEEKIGMAGKIEQICLKDKRVKKSCGASTETGLGISCLANSNGFSGAFRRSFISTGVSLQSGENDNLFDEGMYDFSRSLNDLMHAEEIAEQAVYRVTRLIGAKKIPTENMPVVFEREAASGILEFLTACVSGAAIYRQQSFLREKIGKKIASEYVTVFDDGLLPGAPGTRPFDGEGVPARKTTVIEKGVLKNVLLDTYFARKLHMKSTGNGSGITNFYLAEGGYSQENIIKSVKKGLYLTGFMGQGTDPATGSFSKGAFGLLIENGELTLPVAEVTISGNLEEMLQNITMIGNDLKHNGRIVSPCIKIEEMTVSGK